MSSLRYSVFLLSVVTSFLSTMGSVKSSFTFKLHAESDFGATHRRSVPDKEGIKLRLFVSPQTNFISCDVGAKTWEVLTKTQSSSCISLSRENLKSTSRSYPSFSFPLTSGLERSFRQARMRSKERRLEVRNRFCVFICQSMRAWMTSNYN